MKQVHLYISGRVQGVAFRWATDNAAKSYGLTGWVRNLADGRVEVVAEGEPEILETFIKWCHQGPPSARVDDIETQWFDASGKFKKFAIRY